jgi:hypothetical protein
MENFTDPARLIVGRGQVDPHCRHPRAHRTAPVAQRDVVAADLQMLAVLDHQITQAQEHLAALLPGHCSLASAVRGAHHCSGWAVVRASAYDAAIGDPDRKVRTAAALQGVRAVAYAVGVRWQTPPRCHQP